MNCTESAYRLNKCRMVPIAEYSRDSLKRLRVETGIACDERMQGTLQLFRTQEQLGGIDKDIEILKAARTARPKDRAPPLCRLLPLAARALGWGRSRDCDGRALLGARRISAHGGRGGRGDGGRVDGAPGRGA
jgi:hypothetical protein